MKLAPIERLFSGRTIARQLATLRTLLIVSFMLVGVGYVGAVLLQNRALSQNLRINEFRQTALEISQQTLQARRDEKDFLMGQDAASIEAHKKTMAALGERTERALALAPDDASKSLVMEVEKLLRQYESSFEKVAKASATLGFDENSGLHGKLRDAVHRVEKSLAGTPNDALMVSMLMMRRHEKDYIQRQDAKTYMGEMNDEKARFDKLLPKSSLPADKKAQIASDMEQYQAAFRDYVAGNEAMQGEMDVMAKAARATEPIVAKLQDESRAMLQAADTRLTIIMTMLHFGFAAMLLVGAVIIVGGLMAVSQSIMRPMARLTDVIRRLSEGDDSARTRIESKDEFGQMGRAFDGMMEERVATQNAIQRENEQLNDSVLNLLQAVAQLARKDLTIRVPVTEDVTGPVADALNLLTSETGKVLQEVSDISADVTAASLKVKEQADTVREVAADGRREVEHTAESLAVAATTLNQIAELAQECNVSADNAIRTTQQALRAVADTVGGINNTRDTIRETEKRIKRLGERSQEISGAVNLINTIAERTHILALNASMHAASAGEAGRGFAVVADEVQRLAENARQATAQIASLVNNIQVETLDTVNTMNAAIAQVVEGSRLAEQASDRMVQTEERTSELVSLVQRIAESSTEQAKVSNDLLRRASDIRKSTEETGQKIEEASRYTTNLVEYARNLLSAVRVFRLPG